MEDYPHTLSDYPRQPGRAEEPPPKRPRRWALPAFAAVSLAGAGVAGYYANRLYSEKTAADEKVAKLEDENRSLSDALELHRNSKIELDSKLRDCKKSQKSTSAELVGASTELTACRSNVENLEEQKKKAKELRGEFETLTSRFRKMIDSGKLDVVFRRGEMVVKLPAAVLFSSGSATLSEGGKAALAEVAKVLRKMPRRRFTVAGHTDNVPVHGEEFDSNWDLSTARAVTVTSMLIKKGVRPRSLVAAGYGQYAPISSNRTEAGRRRNRRIEIILEPDLRKLPLRKLRSERRRKKHRRHRSARR